MKNLTIAIVAAFTLTAGASLANADEVTPPTTPKAHAHHRAKPHTVKKHAKKTHTKGADTTPAAK